MRKRDLVQDPVHVLSPPPPPHTSVPSSLPPSRPAAEALHVGSTLSSARGWGWGVVKRLGESSKVWMKEQWMLSGSQVLQRLVALLLQVTRQEARRRR